MRYFVFLPLFVSLACGDDPTVCDDSWTVAAETITAARCGQANGAITLSTPEAKGSVTYRLNDGLPQTSSTFNELRPGRYDITIQDEAGCTTHVSVTVPDEQKTLTVTTEITPAACNQATGRITPGVSGGTAPYQYRTDSVDFGSKAVLGGLFPGEYQVTVRDAEGCTATVGAQVPSGVSFTATIKEIISTHCALPGCHVSGHPANFEVRENIFAYADRIRERIRDRSMPLGRELTNEQINQIACWVEDGAPDN